MPALRKSGLLEEWVPSVRGCTTAVRKLFIFAVLLALVAMPMAFAGTGFCQAMPCCAPQVSAAHASMDHPDCCKTTSCEQPPTAAGDFTINKQSPPPSAAMAASPIAIVRADLTFQPALAHGDTSPPLAIPPLQRRIALLSTLLV